MGPLTEAQKAVIRAQGMRCRGPRLLGPDRTRAELTAFYAAEEAGDAAKALALGQALAAEMAALCAPHAKDPKPWAPPEPPRPGYNLFEETFRIIGAHTEACGQDVGEMGVAFWTEEGAEHLHPCPNCGTAISWRAPVF